MWCSWYEYFTAVTEDDIHENLRAMDSLELPVDVVQIDDGYQSALGDWLTLSGRFRSRAALADAIRARGQRAGIWTAPFLVAPHSELARSTPTGWSATPRAHPCTRATTGTTTCTPSTPRTPRPGPI